MVVGNYCPAKTDNWGDAQRMTRENPDTFYAPSLDMIENLKIGDFVKICSLDHGERFWVIVKRIEKSLDSTLSVCDWKIVGKVSNQLIGDMDYNYGDLVKFEGRHIYNIMSEQ